MKHLVCLLEERSAQYVLESILPRLFHGVEMSFQYLVFEGKQDLEKRLKNRLKGYRKPDAYFLVMRDQDSGNCVKIKEQLWQKVRNSGKEERTLIRIACRELESFFLGDLQAVGKALNAPKIQQQKNKKKFRNPDTLGSPYNELKKIDKNYTKTAGARSIAEYMALDGTNLSRSFNALIDGLLRIKGQRENQCRANL